MATHEPVNFSGSSSGRIAWRRTSSDGGAQLKADSIGGKSPGKIRKFSLFKKTSSKDDLLSGGSGRFERSSGRGKKKSSKGSSSRDSSLDNLSSDNEPRNQLETDGRTSTAVSGGVASSSKPPIAKSQTRDYAISDSQEPEHRSASELSARKVQKINKELTKQNNQLNKDVDTLRRENEALQSEKLKLKGENKTLERELRRVSSKGEVQRILKNGPAEIDMEEIAAEQRMLERDQKLEALKRKLEKQLECFQQRDAADKLERMEHLLPESEKQSNSGVWDSKTALKRLVEEQDISSRLHKENMELKSKLASLEADLEQLVKARSSPKNSRIKPGNLFRRSKRGGESQKEKLTPASSESQRARSPDIPLSDLLTFDAPSSLEGTPIHKPLPAHISPNQSPKLETRDRQNSEIQELKSRVRSAEEDKHNAEKRNAELEAELHEVKSQLEALQVKVEEGRKSSEEVDKLKKSLKMANSEKMSLSGQIQHLRKELDELKRTQRSAERSTTESLKKKESRIEELELDCSKAKKEREKLQKELESSKGLVVEMKRKDSRMEELEGECSKARNECEKLQKELESAKAAIAEAKTEPKVTSTSTNVHTHSAAKPPSGANRHSSPSHSVSSSKPAHSVGKTTSTSSTKIASSPVSSTSDSVFGETESHSNKVTSDLRKLSSDSNKSVGEPAASRATRKSSAESIGENKSENQPRSRRNSKSPPRLRKRRSSTELIEMFEHSKETLKPAEANVKRNPSFANLATSVSHRAKVAATRAMFEGKNDDEPAKTPTTATVSLRSESKSSANRNIYRRSWTGDITQLRRSNHNEPTPITATIPEGKEAVMLHAKSQSVDTTQQFKPGPSSSSSTNTKSAAAAAAATSTSSVSINSSPKHTTSTPAPSKPISLNLTSTTSSKKIDSTTVQQHSASSTPSSGVPSSSTSLTVTPVSTPGVSKVSKITIKSASSPSTSPQLNTRKEVREITVGTSMRAEKVTIPVTSSGSSVSVSVGQRSRMISSSSTATAPIKSPTTPSKSPTTPLKSPNTPPKTPTTPVKVPTTPVKSNISESITRTSSVVVTSNGVAKTPSYVPSYVRSNTVSGGESATSKVKTPAVTRSLTGVKFTVTTTGSTPLAPQPIRTNIVSPQAQPEHGVLKRGSSLLNSPSDLKKTSSLLDIPENIDEANESSSSSHTPHTPVGNSNPPTSPGSSLGVSETPTVIHRSPVQTRIQRRKREDRPKTMYVGARSETVSLVRLISKYQEQERREKGETNTNTVATSAPASTQVPAINGNASPIPAAATTFSSSAGSSTSSGSNTTVVKSHTPRPRPQSYYGGSSDLIGSGFSTPAAVPVPSNMSSGRKPKKARRSQTVALGGINRQSKKAMLLRWCQLATDHYDNVSIDNFGESFADGLAFCALLHHFIPDQIPYNKLNASNREQNFRIAFEEAEKVGIPRLLDVEDMVALPIPDWMSVMTYITFVYNKFGKKETSVA